MGPRAEKSLGADCTKSLEGFLGRLDPTGSLDSYDLVQHDPDLARALGERLASLPDEAPPETVSVDAVGGPGEAPSPGGAKKSRYRVLEVLGEGGMGRVVKALDRTLERVVAIKRLRPTDRKGERRIAQFLAEAKSIARLKHPHIVQIHDIAEDADGYFIVMEYVQGGDLHDLLKRQGRLPLGRALRLAIGVCEALAFAHDQGVIHRDVKPRNILIEDGTVAKLADFGLALGPYRSGTGESRGVVGTPVYMAPEQLDPDRTVDARADIYALGMTICQMLTDQIPPTRCESDIPSVVRHLIMQATAPAPEDRFESAGPMHRALQDVAARHFEQSVVKNCAVCGGSIGPTDEHCPSCDSPLDLLRVLCASCGKKSPIDKSTCAFCGETLDEQVEMALATLDAIRRVEQGEWRDGMDRLVALQRRMPLSIRAAELLQELQCKVRKVDQVRTDARRWIAQGRSGEALDTWKELLELEPSDAEANEATQSLEPLVQQEKVRSLCDLVRRAIREKRFSEAQKQLQRLGTMDPDHADLTALAGEVARAKKKHAEHLAARGAGLFREGKYYEAFTLFDGALDLSDDPVLKKHLSVAVELAREHERLRRVDTYLDARRLRAAQRALDELADACQGKGIRAEIRSRRERLRTLAMWRRLRRIAAGGVAGLLLVIGVAQLNRMGVLWFTNRELQQTQVEDIEEALESCARATTVEDHREHLAVAKARFAKLPEAWKSAKLERAIEAGEKRQDAHSLSKDEFERTHAVFQDRPLAERIAQYCLLEQTWTGADGGYRARDQRNELMKQLEDETQQALMAPPNAGGSPGRYDDREVSVQQEGLLGLRRVLETWRALDPERQVDIIDPGVVDTARGQVKLVNKALAHAEQQVLDAMNRRLHELEDNWDFSAAGKNASDYLLFWGSNKPTSGKTEQGVNMLDYRSTRLYRNAEKLIGILGPRNKPHAPDNLQPDDIWEARVCLENLAARRLGLKASDFYRICEQRLHEAQRHLDGARSRRSPKREEKGSG